tara:strand:+ start:282 stop:473 length:192 start_codon:yes stop_codon:yes gene_type:complete
MAGKKPDKKLTDQQKQMMQKHRTHHSGAHTQLMTHLMRSGLSFKQAHEQTLKRTDQYQLLRKR